MLNYQYFTKQSDNAKTDEILDIYVERRSRRDRLDQSVWSTLKGSWKKLQSIHLRKNLTEWSESQIIL
jgi:hypothetical protein